MGNILKIAGEYVLPGKEKSLQINIAKLYDFTDLSIPIYVINGKESGPTMFISAAIHGDEINGVEIIRKLIAKKSIRKIKGTLILVPVVNVFGFHNKSRYLPDRRDLNRSFPGNSKGSLAARLANIFMKEIVSKCDFGIDLHTASNNRNNLPQIRANFEDRPTRELARAFNAPLSLNSSERDGSLREACTRKKVKVLLYEAGQPLRHDEDAIKIGFNGCMRVMEKIGMLKLKKKSKTTKTIFTEDSIWFRAPHSGTVRFKKKLGDSIKVNDVIAEICDLFGHVKIRVPSSVNGIMIGCTELPLVNQGDAIANIATSKKFKGLKKNLNLLMDYQ